MIAQGWRRGKEGKKKFKGEKGMVVIDINFLVVIISGQNLSNWTLQFYTTSISVIP